MKLLPPPGPERRRQLGALAVLVIVGGVFAWRQWAPARSTPPASNPSPVVPRAATYSNLPEPVALAALKAVPDSPEAGRNPFGFGERPAPPPPPPRPFVAPAPLPPPVLAPPEPEGPPPIPLKLAGIVTAEAGRTIVTLKDPTSNGLFQAFEGDVVDGRYRVVKVGTQSVVVSYLDGSGARTLQLGG